MVVFRYDDIHEATPAFAATIYEIRVARRDKHYRHKSDMLRKPLVGLVVALEHLLLSTRHRTDHMFLSAIVVQVMPLNHHEITAMRYRLHVNGIYVTPAERKIVDGIQKICLALAIATNKTIDFGR